MNAHHLSSSICEHILYVTYILLASTQQDGMSVSSTSVVVDGIKFAATKRACKDVPQDKIVYWKSLMSAGFASHPANGEEDSIRTDRAA